MSAAAPAAAPSPARSRSWRALRDAEVAALESGRCASDDWSAVRVADPFDPARVRGCRFSGTVRIGPQKLAHLERFGMRLPVGLFDSSIADCVLGQDVSIQSVGHLAGYTIGDCVIVRRVDEMIAGGDMRPIRIAVGNESGGRAIGAFPGMTCADAWLWSRRRDDPALLGRLEEMAEAACAGVVCGVVGDNASIRSCRFVRDARFGPSADVHGADRLENVFLDSRPDAPVEIGEGAWLRDALIGEGCRVLGGVKTERVAVMPHVALLNGAVVANSVIGENSTIAGAEVLNALIFPGHEQHHQSSFLIAATLLGQSNVAAGAVLGSNHNSRSSDGEIVAGRGFWPGLCASLKHNCRFASFTLLAKGDYPAELNIPLPFSLVAIDEARGERMIVPAFWILHNMYALARNAAKARDRDRRVRKALQLEVDWLAPDTVEEMFTALDLLEEWTGKALCEADGSGDTQPEQWRREGREALVQAPDRVAGLEVFADGLENSRHRVHVHKPDCAHAAYREMIQLYGVETLARFMARESLASIGALKMRLAAPRRDAWVNAGGQLMRKADSESIARRIAARELPDRDAAHAQYAQLAQRFPEDRAAHALAAALELNNCLLDSLDEATWRDWLVRAAAIRRRIADLAQESRAKDYTNPFRRMTYESDAEMAAVVGRLDDNALIQTLRDEAEAFARLAKNLAGP